jgi:hypothetical protein
MNSASYNLKDEDDNTALKDREGIIMRMALQRCASLTDFETLLDTLPKPLGVEANFGVIDAMGGAAYYETDNYRYNKTDVNDHKTAPGGYLIRTNYSFTGNPEEGYGYIRYNTAEKLFEKAGENLSWQYIIREVSRSLYHSLTEEDLNDDPPESAAGIQFVHFQDYIPRHSSSSSVIVQGVNNPREADMITMWTVMGFPLCSVVLPCCLNPDRDLPEVLTPDADGASPLSRMALELRNTCFPVQKGSGYKYLNLPALVNRQGTGVLQRIREIEAKTIKLSEDFLDHEFKKPFADRDFRSFFDMLDQLIYDEFGSISGIGRN